MSNCLGNYDPSGQVKLEVTDFIGFNNKTLTRDSGE